MLFTSLLVPKGECQQDGDCANSQACIDFTCRDQCREPSNPCVPNAECRTSSHRAVCTCRVGWAGNPHEECYQCETLLLSQIESYFLEKNPFLFFIDECRVDNDCSQNKACQSQVCVDPCLQTSCGDRATCEVNFHHPRCVCPPGLQGNPIVRCFEVDCLSDDDCAQSETCDYANKRCVPVCRGYQDCAPNARCEATDHRKECICDPPYEGDGYTHCEKRKLPYLVYIILPRGVLFLISLFLLQASSLLAQSAMSIVTVVPSLPASALGASIPAVCRIPVWGRCSARWWTPSRPGQSPASVLRDTGLGPVEPVTRQLEGSSVPGTRSALRLTSATRAPAHLPASSGGAASMRSAQPPGTGANASALRDSLATPSLRAIQVSLTLLCAI